MGKCYGQSFFCNFSFIKCYLCIVLEQAYGDAPVRQAAFTLKMVFFPGFPDNCKVGVRDPFLVRGILLVYKMFVWKNHKTKNGADHEQSIRRGIPDNFK